MERFRRLFASEKEKLKGRPWKEKLQYIWEYYHLWIIGIGFAVFMIIYLIWHFTTGIGENWISVAFPNAMTDMGNGSPFWEEYVEASGYDIREKNVDFNSSLYFDPTTLSGTANNYYQAFVAMIEAGTLDAVTLPRPQMEALGQSGRLLDLSSDETAGLFRKYEDRLVYSLPIDEEYSTEPVPVGIDVSDSILMTQYHIYDDSCVLGISEYSSHIDAVEEFLSWILEEDAA